MSHLRNRARGFSLIELMVTVIIIAILAAIALPSYQRYVVGTRRAAATACLIEMAQVLERTYTTSMSYAGANVGGRSCQSDLSAFYAFGPNGAFTATAFSIQAVPQGGQATRDTDCGTLRLNQAGTRSATGPGGVGECW